MTQWRAISFVCLGWLILLVACVPPAKVIPPGEPLPIWVVLITGPLPDVEGRCTGVALSEELILTARHCFKPEAHSLKRLVTQLGQEVFRFEVVVEVKELDTIVLRVSQPLKLPAFAVLSTPHYNQPALIFGACPRYLMNVARRADFVEEHETRFSSGERYPAEKWHIQVNVICGGDSGGPAVQDGRMVGMLHAIDADIPWIAMGENVYLISAKRMVEALAGECEVEKEKNADGSHYTRILQC